MWVAITCENVQTTCIIHVDTLHCVPTVHVQAFGFVGFALAHKLINLQQTENLQFVRQIG